MTESFDLIVLGTGSAASAAPGLAREEGWRVAVIDSRPYGGTCALRGCDPKKVLLGAAALVDQARRMSGKGVVSDRLEIDWSDLMAFKRSFTKPVPGAKEEALQEMGIETLHGRARFVGKRAIEVDGRRLVARKILIATGARPATLDIPGEELLTTSDGFLDLDHLPMRIVFVGGGYIAFEFAHLAARAGAEVVVLHRGERPLEGFDSDLVARLAEVSGDVGIDVRVEHSVERVERDGDRFRVVADSSDDGEVRFQADLVVHAAGRTAEIDDLDLETGGIERGKRGILVDPRFQSVSNPDVYAAGDAAETDGMPLTPVAGKEGEAAARNLVGGENETVNYAGLPTVVFTIPPLASVGMTEEEARDTGVAFDLVHEDSTDWYSARRTAARVAAHKILIEKGSGRIVGAHLLGESAAETINVFALAIRHGITAEDVASGLYAYPTHGSDLPHMVKE